MTNRRASDEPEPEPSQRHTADRWLEASVCVVPEAAEAVAEVLSRYAPGGVVIDAGVSDQPDKPVTVKAYLAFGEDVEARRRKVVEGLGHLSHIWSVIPAPTFRIIEDQDWTRGWKQTIPVLHLGDRLVIKPTWRAYTAQAEEIVLELDPGIAFGTGLHPTTQLCLAMLEEALDERALGERAAPVSILDLGTGTGILAIAASKLTQDAGTGAGLILAVDTDSHAVTAARRNAEANDVAGRIEIHQGSLADAPGAYDVVLANILTSVIIAMAGEGLADRVRPGGILVASGILVEQADDVTRVLEDVGLIVTEVRCEDAWVAVVARHQALDDHKPAT